MERLVDLWLTGCHFDEEIGKLERFGHQGATHGPEVRVRLRHGRRAADLSLATLQFSQIKQLI